MIKSLDELRRFAVKHILRRGPADYLLRHSLCKPWVDSTSLDEMAWTDFKRLYFNFPKLRAAIDNWESSFSAKLDPGDHVTAFLAATSHEILHVLWLHRYRCRGKKKAAWEAACEYAINYELAVIFGVRWISHLDVMYPPKEMIAELQARGLPTTTDGFYELLSQSENHIPSVSCTFCSRAAAEGASQSTEIDQEELIRSMIQLPMDSPERDDILRFISDHHAPPQKVPWEMLLLGGIEEAMNQEQSWTTPSRRHDLLPGWRREKMLSFVWVLDVSPSIDDEMKRSFMSTLQAGINLYHDAQHRVIFFASGVERDIMVSSGTNLSNMEIPCGSGTSLLDVWEILEADLPEYALVLTDLELSPVPKPSYTKIIWGIVDDCRYFDPDYGIKIVLK